MLSFERMCCTPQVRAAFDEAVRPFAAAAKTCALARVSSLDRGYPLVCAEQIGELRAEPSAAIKKSADGIIAIGDWVVLALPDAHEKAVIEAVLPRRTEIARVKRVGREKQLRRQVLAANVDTVLVCQSLTGNGLDMDLLVRQAAAVMGCGARAAFVFTKGDLVADADIDAWLGRVRAVMPDVGACVVSAGDASALESVHGLVPPGTCAMLLGESGVGKSTLVNALVGSEARATGDVRSSDDKGRHTTVARRMVEVPDGGIIIDAPGLRTLQIIDLEKSLAAAFPDIVGLAVECRFRDCTHANEPGCAVRDEVPSARLEAYHRLVERDWRRR